ncbi:MAG TPA: 2-oxoacid:acceptor oxidoreductase subunit alpha, partial [Gemmatimonadetes bacterium]|nr:2-oxoacid:acceptor oxidoreductase subunit alpha [Gemmatimonadota bacterium]
NIQGLPTWYEVRANKSGHLARRAHPDVMVAMNPKTYEQDIAETRSGGTVLYDSSWPLDEELLRDDVSFLGVPLSQMCVESFRGSRERILMKNIAYVGALAALLTIDLEVIDGILK